MTNASCRRIRSHGIRFGGRWYSAPELAGLLGQVVEVRAGRDPGTIDVQPAGPRWSSADRLSPPALVAVATALPTPGHARRGGGGR